jgi:hypothetical protein
MSKRSDPLLNPDSTWLKCSRSYRIHNTGTINIFSFFFSRYVRMHNCPFQGFLFTPFFLLLQILVNIFCRQKIDGTYCSFYRKLFTVMFSNVFFPSMMRLFLSLLQGAVIFLFAEKRGIYRNLAILS